MNISPLMVWQTVWLDDRVHLYRLQKGEIVELGLKNMVDGARQRAQWVTAC